MTVDDVTVHILTREDTARRLNQSRVAEVPSFWPWARDCGKRTRRMGALGPFPGLPIRYVGDPTEPRRDLPEWFGGHD